MRINAQKTKFISIVNATITIIIDGKTLDQVTTFTYLDTVITKDCSCKKDIRSRLGKTFRKLVILPNLAALQQMV